MKNQTQQTPYSASGVCAKSTDSSASSENKALYAGKSQINKTDPFDALEEKCDFTSIDTNIYLRLRAPNSCSRTTAGKSYTRTKCHLNLMADEIQEI